MTTKGMNDNSLPKGIELRADTAIQGLQTALPPTLTQLTVGTVNYQIPALIKFVQDAEEPWKQVRAAHALIRQIIQARPVDYQNLLNILADLKTALATVLGRDSETLTKFGFIPAKRKKPLTTEQKALRAAKAKLTRQKRGTLGSKQKAAIKTTETPSVTISPDGSVAIVTTSVTPAMPVSTNESAPAAAKPAV